MTGQKSSISENEYLEAERKALNKHEYYRGEIFAMAGASIEHNRIVRNTLNNISSYLKKGKCEPFGSDLRVHIPSNSLYTYPDITVICGKIETAESKPDTVLNPSVIFEVLSEATKDYDRGSKFMLYRAFKTLKEYILIVSTGSVMIEKYQINNDGLWELQEYKNQEDILKIEHLDIEIPLSEIYEGVYA